MKLSELSYEDRVLVARTPHGTAYRCASPLELLEQHFACEDAPQKLHLETAVDMLRVAYAGVPFWKSYPQNVSYGEALSPLVQKVFDRFLCGELNPSSEDVCAFRGEVNQFVVVGFRAQASWQVVGFSVEKCVLTFRLEDLFARTPHALRAPMYRVTGECDDVPYLAKQLAFDARLLIPISQSGGFTLNVVPYTEDEND